MKPISLLYHDVIDAEPESSGFPGADANSYKLDESQFVAHLDKIAALGSQRVQVLPHSGVFAGPPANPILLTFDDGGVSANKPTAYLLEQRNWRGHFFIVTARIGQPGFLSAEQIRDLDRRGHRIGSHSHTHPPQFSKLTCKAMLNEWQESRRILADILGRAPRSVSVPGGFFSRDVARAAREAGYEVLFNSEPTSQICVLDGLTILGRYGIKRNTTAVAAQTLARGDFAPRLAQFVVWNLKKPAKTVGGKAWFTLRRWLFERSAA